jgi:5'(3')-deoxyribonucleotidase
MRIAVDLDGVCYEWQRTYRYMLREYRGVDMPPVEDFWHYWDAQKQYGTRADHRWMWNHGVARGLFRYGHVVKGARRGLEALAEQGHDLCIVTSRPANAAEDTHDWIELFFKGIPLSGVHILSNREPKSTVDADVLIDDRPENVEEWYAAGRTAVLFCQPWNDAYIPRPRDLHVAVDWPDVVTLIGQLEKGEI